MEVYTITKATIGSVVQIFAITTYCMNTTIGYDSIYVYFLFLEYSNRKNESHVVWKTKLVEAL